MRVRVQVFVHWRADDHHHVFGPGDDLRVRCRLQPRGRDHPFEHLRRPRLVEGHDPGTDHVDRYGVEVVDTDMKAPVGESQSEGKPDVAATSHDYDVKVKLHCIS